MAKFLLNEKCVNMIKTLRIQHNVKVNTIAVALGKSPSYITKLERGIIKSIEEDELKKIFASIFGQTEEIESLLDKNLNQIFEELSRVMNDTEIKHQVWFMNYDTVFRILPVSPALSRNLSDRLKALNMDIVSLCDRINANEELTDEERNNKDNHKNRWNAVIKNGTIDHTYIFMKVDSVDVRRVLKYEVGNANYILVYAIAYYIAKIEKFGNEINVSHDDIRVLQKETIEYLNKYKFYTLMHKRQSARMAASKEEYMEKLSSFDQDNLELMEGVVGHFARLSETFVSRTNKYLKVLNSNLDWDAGFMMALMSIPFSELGNLSFNSKQEMLNEINQVVKKYKNLPDEKKIIENYKIGEEK